MPKMKWSIKHDTTFGREDQMRERAMERLAKTKKRNGKDEPRKKHQKTNDTLDYLEVGSREGISVKARRVGDKEEARRSYHGHSAGIVHSAARSTAFTDEATAVYADDAGDA